MPPGGVFDPEDSQQRLSELEELTADPELWSDRSAAEAILTELKRLKGSIDPWKSLRTAVTELDELLSLIHI